MSQGPTHPSIQREVRRVVRSARIRLAISAVVVCGLFWGLHHPERVVAWSQQVVADILPGILQVVD